jgi:hypothetical protein
MDDPKGGHSATSSQQPDRSPDSAGARPERSDILLVEKRICLGLCGRANEDQALRRRESKAEADVRGTKLRESIYQGDPAKKVASPAVRR